MNQFILLKNKSKCCGAEVMVCETGTGFGGTDTKYYCLKCVKQIWLDDVKYVGKGLNAPKIINK